MYSISDYGAMIADKVRTQAFARALRDAITPDSKDTLSYVADLAQKYG
jgi:hypothetical protein